MWVQLCMLAFLVGFVIDCVWVVGFVFEFGTGLLAVDILCGVVWV